MKNIRDDHWINILTVIASVIGGLWLTVIVSILTFEGVLLILPYWGFVETMGLILVSIAFFESLKRLIGRIIRWRVKEDNFSRTVQDISLFVFFPFILALWYGMGIKPKIESLYAEHERCQLQKVIIDAKIKGFEAIENKKKCLMLHQTFE